MTRVFLVDDQALVRAGFRLVIDSQPDMTVVGEAGDGREALEKYDPAAVDFVITDWNMPNMSGTDLAKALRARSDAGRTVPILMVTARSVKEDILTAMEAGVNNYIVKPFTPQVLKEKIDALLTAPAAS